MVCKYCKKELKKYDCNKLSKRYKTLPLISFFVGDFLNFLRGFIFYESKKERMSNKGIVVTCVNKDCINYLSGCKDRNLLGVEV